MIELHPSATTLQALLSDANADPEQIRDLADGLAGGIVEIADALAERNTPARTLTGINRLLYGAAPPDQADQLLCSDTPAPPTARALHHIGKDHNMMYGQPMSDVHEKDLRAYADHAAELARKVRSAQRELICERLRRIAHAHIPDAGEITFIYKHDITGPDVTLEDGTALAPDDERAHALNADRDFIALAAELEALAASDSIGMVMIAVARPSTTLVPTLAVCWEEYWGIVYSSAVIAGEDPDSDTNSEDGTDTLAALNGRFAPDPGATTDGLTLWHATRRPAMSSAVSDSDGGGEETRRR